jgi:hypothetical protein
MYIPSKLDFSDLFDILALYVAALCLGRWLEERPGSR